eukprot:scaffold1141_cov369-Prasinococcus_capsulatus_cf.AAC.6
MAPGPGEDMQPTGLRVAAAPAAAAQRAAAGCAALCCMRPARGSPPSLFASPTVVTTVRPRRDGRECAVLARGAAHHVPLHRLLQHRASGRADGAPFSTSRDAVGGAARDGEGRGRERREWRPTMNEPRLTLLD